MTLGLNVGPMLGLHVGPTLGKPVAKIGMIYKIYRLHSLGQCGPNQRHKIYTGLVTTT